MLPGPAAQWGPASIQERQDARQVIGRAKVGGNGSLTSRCGKGEIVGHPPGFHINRLKIAVRKGDTLHHLDLYVIIKQAERRTQVVLRHKETRPPECCPNVDLYTVDRQGTCELVHVRTLPARQGRYRHGNDRARKKVHPVGAASAGCRR